jgi:hypothetical protein
MILNVAPRFSVFPSYLNFPNQRSDEGVRHPLQASSGTDVEVQAMSALEGMAGIDWHVWHVMACMPPVGPSPLWGWHVRAYWCSRLLLGDGT